MKQQSPGLVVVDLQPAYAGLDFGSSISSGLMEGVIGHIRKLPCSTPVLAFTDVRSQPES